MSTFTPPEVWCGKAADEVRSFHIDYNELSSCIFSAASGPDIGVEFVSTLSPSPIDTNSNNNVDQDSTQLPDDKSERQKSKIHWSCMNRRAYGQSLSLYDKNPVTGKVSGDPIADCFAYVARKNNSLLVIADGVNWGEKSRLAARCAVNEAVNFIHESIFIENCQLQNSQDALLLMRKAFDRAHDSIIKHNGGLTTLNITMVLPILQSSQYVVCCVNVGDSLTYVFSKRYGMNELSIGSHDITEERNMRDVGGALGPVCGDMPYLVNLTFSVTTCEPGDIVFLTTDGISDNFDPVVTKIAVPGKKDSMLTSIDKKAEMLPHERHLFSMKGMELVIHEYELVTETDISAQELCIALTDHVTKLTQSKRLVIENPQLYNRQYRAKERRKIEETIKKTLRTLPGKLDHATVIAYETGLYIDETTPNTSYEIDNSQSESGSQQSDSSSNMKHSTSTYFESNV